MLKQAIYLSLSLIGLLLFGDFASPQDRARVRTVNAGDYRGSDLGAQINAADKALGAGAGEIIARGGGVITTPVVISAGHTLRLSPGVYAPRTKEIPFLLQAGASIIGASRDNTIILESTAEGQFTVIGAYNNARRNGDADSDLTIRDVQIKGANPGFSSAPQAISLGNCSRCTVDRVWINGTRSIGIQLGGSAQYGNYARDSKITNNLLTAVASQAIAVVNGENIEISNNQILKPGQPGGPGCTSIDLEPNGDDDHLINIRITNNLIDHRDAAISPTGNGILIQSVYTPKTDNILVEGNTIIGGHNSPNKITNHLSNGIYCFGSTLKGVTIRNNRITRTGQAGINLEGTGFIVINNQLTDVGGGGTPGFFVKSVTNSRIEGNSFTYTGQGPADGRMLIQGATRNNVIRNNQGLASTN
jgi:hypothetical protein